METLKSSSTIMDGATDVTVTKIQSSDRTFYLLILWRARHFDIQIIISDDNIFCGSFTKQDTKAFSSELGGSEEEYFTSTKEALTRQREDFKYELTSSVFFWKRIYKDAIIIQGFARLCKIKTKIDHKTYLLDTIIQINYNLWSRMSSFRSSYLKLKHEFDATMSDTLQFVTLKTEMDKELHKKFLALMRNKRNQAEGKKISRSQIECDQSLAKSTVSIHTMTSVP